MPSSPTLHVTRKFVSMPQGITRRHRQTPPFLTQRRALRLSGPQKRRHSWIGRAGHTAPACPEIQSDRPIGQRLVRIDEGACQILELRIRGEQKGGFRGDVLSRAGRHLRNWGCRHGKGRRFLI